MMFIAGALMCPVSAARSDNADIAIPLVEKPERGEFIERRSGFLPLGQADATISS
ncbi:MAG TPA: hypothetical protein VES97_02725 [Solirubrobacteraceae bacterium]|nr:hypothetical protein [Solirubrobacteraceae bacterium]